MKLKIKENQVNTYEKPMCLIIEVALEGILCASMEQLEEDENEYGW